MHTNHPSTFLPDAPAPAERPAAKQEPKPALGRLAEIRDWHQRSSQRPGTIEGEDLDALTEDVGWLLERIGGLTAAARQTIEALTAGTRYVDDMSNPERAAFEALCAALAAVEGK